MNPSAPAGDNRQMPVEWGKIREYATDEGRVVVEGSAEFEIPVR